MLVGRQCRNRAAKKKHQNTVWLAVCHCIVLTSASWVCTHEIMLPAAAGVLVVVAVVVVVVVVVAGVVLVVLILVLLYDVLDVLPGPSLIWHSFMSKSICKVVGSPHSQKAWWA